MLRTACAIVLSFIAWLIVLGIVAIIVRQITPREYQVSAVIGTITTIWFGASVMILLKYLHKKKIENQKKRNPPPSEYDPGMSVEERCDIEIEMERRLMMGVYRPPNKKKKD